MSSGRPTYKYQIHPTPCQCGLQQAVSQHKAEVLELQEQLAESKRRTGELEERLREVERALLDQTERRSGDEPRGSGQNSVCWEDLGTEQEAARLRELLAEEEARQRSISDWPTQVSRARVAMWMKYKLITRILGEIWKEEHILLSEHSQMTRELARQRGEGSSQESETGGGRQGRNRECDLQKEIEDLKAQIVRQKDQLAHIARLSSADQALV